MRLPALRIVRRTPPGDSAPQPGPTPPWWRMLDRLRPRSLREALRHNPGLKAISLLLAFFLWFSINVSERDAERVLELPVVIRKLPPDLIVTNAPDRAVTATVRGPRTILDGVDEQRGQPGDRRRVVVGFELLDRERLIHVVTIGAIARS